MSPEQESPPLATADEIEAALAEAEARAAAIPSLDQDTQAPVVRIPVEAQRLAPLPRPSASNPATPDTAQPSGPMAPESTAPPAPSESAKAPAVSVGSARRLASLPYRVADRVLWALNLPFGWVPLSARRLIGPLAIATIVTSLAALFLLPLIYPPRPLVPKPTPPAAASPEPVEQPAAQGHHRESSGH